MHTKRMREYQFMSTSYEVLEIVPCKVKLLVLDASLTLPTLPLY